MYLGWEVSGNVVITITATAGPNAILNGLFLDATTSSTGTATFLESDTTTQGTWEGIYGAQGSDIVGGPISPPSDATIRPSGQSAYTWTTTSNDARALQLPGSSNRVAAVWYSTTSFSVDVNLGDGQEHDLELYFDDWDNKGRAETVQISTAAGAVLDTETISSFIGGKYLGWEVSGDVVITITAKAGPNAVLNGLFLDATTSSTGTASFIESDTTTQGTWEGIYGAQGSVIAGGPISPPSDATIKPFGQSAYTWTTTSTDARALQLPGSSNRIAAVWYSPTSFSVDVNLGDGQEHDLELYFDDWDNKGRAETVQISTAAGVVLSTETISSFAGGKYLDWEVSGNVVITITAKAGPNAVLNGLFLDAATSSTGAASFLKSDTTTRGTWEGIYGVQGSDIVSGPISLPSYATVRPSGQSTYTWTTTSTDARALQLPGSSNRIAAVWYSPTSFSLGVNLGDGQAHDLELYFDDWDSKGRAETVQISTAAGAVLSTETISSFAGGEYLDWEVSGNVVITITATAGPNAVLNGLFLDNPT